MSKQLATNKSNITLIFRRIVKELKTDKEFSRVFGANIRSWEGTPQDKAPFAPTQDKPTVRLTPTPRNQTWRSPDSQRGVLVVNVEMAINSLCIDDVSDCWDVLVTALSPFKMELVRDLVQVGAETGEIVFTDPEYVANPEAQPQGLFLANGKFQLDYMRMVNPRFTPD